MVNTLLAMGGFLILSVVLMLPSVRLFVFGPPREALIDATGAHVALHRARTAIYRLGRADVDDAQQLLTRMIADPERRPEDLSRAKLTLAELFLMRELVYQIAISIDPDVLDEETRTRFKRDASTSMGLIEAATGEAERSRRMKALYGFVVLGQKSTEVAVGDELSVLFEVAPLWRGEARKVPPGIIPPLLDYKGASPLVQSVRALALWRIGDLDNARNLVQETLKLVGDHPVATTLYIALDRQDLAARPNGEQSPTPEQGEKTPPLRAPPETVSVFFEASTRAEIIVDGISKGTTPRTIDLPCGLREVELKARGFEDYTEVVDFQANGQKTLKAKLIRQSRKKVENSGDDRAKENAPTTKVEFPHLDSDNDAPTTKVEVPRLPAPSKALTPEEARQKLKAMLRSPLRECEAEHLTFVTRQQINITKDVQVSATGEVSLPKDASGLKIRECLIGRTNGISLGAPVEGNAFKFNFSDLLP